MPLTHGRGERHVDSLLMRTLRGRPNAKPWMRAPVVLGALLLAPQLGAAQATSHAHVVGMQELPLDIPASRLGSGTSWLPDGAPMRAYHAAAGAWTLMIHGVVFGVYDRQFGLRGDAKLGSINWGMLEAARSMGGGRMALRGMVSAEPWTIGRRGYPLLLQSGEAFGGAPLHDRQHPHDLVMEAAVLFQHALSRTLAAELYLAPVGEPALGPPAFPHRPSAADLPLAPIAHHWQDATHVTFGVVTAGLFTRRVKLEASLFNGREPNEIRTNFDYAGRRLDSYAVRVTANPCPAWSLSASGAHLSSPEALAPHESITRVTVSVLHASGGTAARTWSHALIYGANAHDGHVDNSVLAESDLVVDARHRLFARAEFVRKRSGDLDLAPGSAAAAASVGEVTLGYARALWPHTRASIAIGALATVNVVPGALEPIYGSRLPRGVAVYARLAPPAMQPHATMRDMPGMPAPR